MGGQQEQVREFSAREERGLRLEVALMNSKTAGHSHSALGLKAQLHLVPQRAVSDMRGPHFPDEDPDHALGRWEVFAMASATNVLEMDGGKALL